MHQRRAAHAPLGDLGQPDRVGLVGLGPPRHVLHIAGVDQPARKAFGFQQPVDPLPIVRGRLHHHPGHPQAVQPVGQRQQRRGGGGIAADLLQATARPGRVRHRTHASSAALPRSSAATRSTWRSCSSTSSIPAPGTGTGKVARRSQRERRVGPSCSWQQCAALGVAPSVKLTYGLTCAKKHRRRRATRPIFPHARRPQGTEELSGHCSLGWCATGEQGRQINPKAPLAGRGEGQAPLPVAAASSQSSGWVSWSRCAPRDPLGFVVQPAAGGRPHRRVVDDTPSSARMASI